MVLTHRTDANMCFIFTFPNSSNTMLDVTRFHRTRVFFHMGPITVIPPPVIRKCLFQHYIVCLSFILDLFILGWIFQVCSKYVPSMCKINCINTMLTKWISHLDRRQVWRLSLWLFCPRSTLLESAKWTGKQKQLPKTFVVIGNRMSNQLKLFTIVHIVTHFDVRDIPNIVHYVNKMFVLTIFDVVFSVVMFFVMYVWVFVVLLNKTIKWLIFDTTCLSTHHHQSQDQCLSEVRWRWTLEIQLFHGFSKKLNRWRKYLKKKEVFKK